MPELRDDLERILLVDLFEDGVLDLGKLQAHESASELQHSSRLLQRLSRPWHVPQPKRDGVSIKYPSLKRQLLGISAYELDIYISSFFTF